MGISEFTSSKFIISQSSAEFINGVGVMGNVDVNAIVSGTLVGDGSSITGGIGSGITMFVGASDGATPPTFTEAHIDEGDDIVLTASSSNGHLNHYTFIANINGEWNVVSSGSNNGLVGQNTYTTPEFENSGVYRYLVIGHSSASNATVVKGTTVKVGGL